MTDQTLHKRLIEALLFAAAEPLAVDELQARLPEGTSAEALLAELAADYAERGVNLVAVAGRWQFRTAADLGPLMRLSIELKRKLSRAALETLAIIAYHQPATRAEIEEVRGVSVSKGTLDLLLEIGWIKPRGHRDAPGKPTLWVTTEAFLEHFGLAALDDLPGMSELRASGLLDNKGPMAAMPVLAGGGQPDEASDNDELVEDQEPDDVHGLSAGGEAA
ncbi:MAG: SMC-Scp complex subunit ScpB [Alphaproteobacteria bacterium]|nr:SMC-Scp complex subunit ScpB [Alphaproteobacteria bacterium]